MENIIRTPIKHDIFSLEDNESRINKLTNGKVKGIEGYQVEILKLGRYILIPHLHKLINSSIKHGFHKTWTQSLIVPIFKNGDKVAPSNYMTIIISHILAKIYGFISDKKISPRLEIHGKRAKGKDGFMRY